MKTYIHTISCTWMFIGPLFIVAKKWKQTKFPSIGKWLDKMWYTYAMEYYLAIKEWDTSWKNLKNIMWSETRGLCFENLLLAIFFVNINECTYISLDGTALYVLAIWYSLFCWEGKIIFLLSSEFLAKAFL